MERPLPLDPTECKLAIRYLNGTDKTQLSSYNYNNSSTYLMTLKNNNSLKDINLASKYSDSTLTTMVSLPIFITLSSV